MYNKEFVTIKDVISTVRSKLDEALRHLQAPHPPHEQELVAFQLNTHEITFQLLSNGRIQVTFNGTYQHEFPTYRVNMVLKRDTFQINSTTLRFPRKRSKIDRAQQICWKLMADAKRGDWENAIHTFSLAVNEQIKLKSESLDTLMYLCAGGEQWETQCRASLLNQPGGIKPSQVEWAERVRKYLEAGDYPISEVTLTATARLAAHTSPQEAANIANTSIKFCQPPKIRTFVPALVGFAVTKQPQAALDLLGKIAEAGLKLAEPEYALILEACNEGSISYDLVSQVLTQMSELEQPLTRATVDHIRRYFLTESANQVLPQTHRWRASLTLVNEDGFCRRCNFSLQQLGLTPTEFDDLASAISNVVSNFRYYKDFKLFQKWLQANGPYDVLIDGANVAYFNQNFDSGAFSFSQIQEVVKHAEKSFPNQRILVILHRNRISKVAEDPTVQEFVRELQSKGQLYLSNGNDDWYWLYASVKAGRKGWLITNDEMGDHIFSLVEHPNIVKFKRDHQVRFNFVQNVPVFTMPSKYTTCVQHVSAANAWMLPLSSTEWMSIIPTAVTPPSPSTDRSD